MSVQMFSIQHYLFYQLTHVDQDGSVLFYGQHNCNDANHYTTNVENIGEDLYKIKDIPPILKCYMTRCGANRGDHLLMLTQDHRLMVMGQLHPNGLILDTVPVKDLMMIRADENYKHCIIDVYGNWRSLIPVEDDNILFKLSDAVIENVQRMGTYMLVDNGGHYITLISGNRFILLSPVANGYERCSYCLSDEVKALSGRVVLTQDNTLYMIIHVNHPPRMRKLIQLDYDVQQIRYCGRLMYTLDSSGILRQYTLKGDRTEGPDMIIGVKELEGLYSQLLCHSELVIAEKLEGGIVLRHYNNATIDIGRKLMNVSQFRALEAKMFNTKKAI